MPAKRGLGINVLEAAKQRIAWAFDTFPRLYVSFSGGKDSTVMLHLVMSEAMQRGRKIGLLFVDWEAQYRLTIEHVQKCFNLYADIIEPYWVSLPLLTTNACSQFEPEWICWEAGKETRWVREPPDHAITDYGYFPFYHYADTFEEFVPAFGHWYSQERLTGCFVGIRAAESLNRWRTIAGHGTKFEGRMWTNYLSQTLWNIYPIYDWQAQDIWAYHGKTGLPHNMLYDRMHQAGLSLSQMRVCEPYGDEQRKGLWLFHVIEPETWNRIVARVAGANHGAIYSHESGNIMGNIKITKPDHLTWEQFAHVLLDSMPERTADHYKDKIAVWLKWYQDRPAAFPSGIEDWREGDTGSKDMPSWRRVCKMLLKNDYWGKTLCFSATKATAYQRYKKIMEKRRRAWGIYA